MVFPLVGGIVVNPLMKIKVVSCEKSHFMLLKFMGLLQPVQGRKKSNDARKEVAYKNVGYELIIDHFAKRNVHVELIRR